MSQLATVPMLPLRDIRLTPVDSWVPPLVNDFFDNLGVQNLGQVHIDEPELLLLGKCRFAVTVQCQAHIGGSRQLLIRGCGHVDVGGSGRSRDRGAGSWCSERRVGS